MTKPEATTKSPLQTCEPSEQLGHQQHKRSRGIGTKILVPSILSKALLVYMVQLMEVTSSNYIKAE